MNKKLKQALTDVFNAPPPVNKESFLKRHRRRELGRCELVAIQIRYIRWWVWPVSLALFGGILWMAAPAQGVGGWYAAAFTPFLALLMAAENGRSQACQMEELELACRMARHSVVLARMVVLGLFHLGLLAGLTPPLAFWGAAGMGRMGVYLLTPYLFTAALGIELTRRVRGRECLLACGGTAVLVSMLGVFLINFRPELYRPEHLPLWGSALALAALAAGAEIILSLKERELQWN